MYTPSPAFLKLADATFRLHKLMLVGEGDTDAADEVREEGVDAHHECTPVEIFLGGNLSGDLYQIEEDEALHSKALPEILRNMPWRTPEGESVDPELARWASVLDIAGGLPGPSRAALRSLAYGALGLPEVAEAFRVYALKKAEERSL
jgi:hypothetical protein